MKCYSQTHLSNEALRREIKNDPAREGEVTAMALARLAEYDARKLYLPDAYPSMLAYCVGELRLSENEAKKRLRVARAARRCPGVFEALAEGRVHLSGMVCLASHLTPETADELLAAADRKTRDEIELVLAKRFPKPGVEARVTAVTPISQEVTAVEGSPGTPRNMDSQAVTDARAPGIVHDRARVAPLSAEAFAVQFTRSREADARFRYLQDLLGHQVARGDFAEVYDRAVKELIKKMEDVRFGVCKRPRKGSAAASDDPRYISRQVKREVWIRDGGRCTYESESGRRCEARGDVEFDHVQEVARGGEATADNLRLRCRGHNQHAAEQTFGAGFMKRKREEAKAARAAAKAAKERAIARKAAEQEASRLQPHQLEVIPWLRELGLREDDCRIAVERCRDMADARLEDRVKRALSWFGARSARTVQPWTPAPSVAPCAT